MSTTLRYIAGGMSGTSADGVDVAICAIDGRGYDMTARLVVHHHRPYNAELRRQIFAFRSGGAGSVSQDTLRALAELGREISLTYAAAVNEALAAAHMESKNLAAVAAHGQTLFHDPPNTIQWLDPSLLAAEVGCSVVSDFRRADLAAGGQGAPLVPFADFILFRDATKNRVLLNLGGIANITWLAAGGTPGDVIAFDTGPANCIVDWIMDHAVDKGGRLSARGEAHRPLVRDVLKAEYFHRPPPKSTDGPEMIRVFRAAGSGGLTLLTDRLATACAVTAESVARAIEQWCPAPADEVIASGGGTKNAAIMNMLREQLGEVPMRTTDELGVPGDAKEAIAFALLGAATLDGVPSNVPSVTGAKRPVVLGSITPRP
jgi:anhydro-N-acetylmuramic acid kinase